MIPVVFQCDFLEAPMVNQQMVITNTQSLTGQAQFVVSTAGVNHFRLNPFQILRLPISASAKQAVWQEEKMLSLLRLGLPLKEKAPIPWLPIANEMDIQQAVQKIEEPLERLVEQLFWFDFEADTRGALLKEALATADADKLSLYLKETEAVPMLDSLPSPQPEKPLEEIEVDHAAKAVEGTISADKKESDQATDDVPDETAEAVGNEKKVDEALEVVSDTIMQAAAHQLNRANLQLLLAVSGFQGIGPMLQHQTPSLGMNNSRLSPLSWQDEGEHSFCLNPHALLTNSTDTEDKSVEWHRFWFDALTTWSKILQNPYFAVYVSHLIQRLEDDLLDPGAVETLYRVIPTRFADILAGEIKNTIREGEGGRVSLLINIAASAQFDRQIWETAFSSLNFYFQTEISDLTNLIEEPDAINPDSIRLYFSRLGQVKQRWQSLDQSDVLRLRKLLDEAVIKGYRAVASLSYVGHKLKEVQNLLDDAASYAVTASVREKINSYKAQIAKFHKHETCHFCEQRERDPNYPVVLKGKKETDRERKGNVTTIHYLIKHTIVPRCKRCADIQDYIRNTGVVCTIAILIGITILLAIYPAPVYLLLYILLSLSYVKLIILAVIGCGIAAVFLIKYLHEVVKRTISRIILPENEIAFFLIEDTDACKDLRRESYNVERIDVRKGALKKTLASAK
jgi:hypothetical protein